MSEFYVVMVRGTRMEGEQAGVNKMRHLYVILLLTLAACSTIEEEASGLPDDVVFCPLTLHMYKHVGSLTDVEGVLFYGARGNVMDVFLADPYYIPGGHCPPGALIEDRNKNVYLRGHTHAIPVAEAFDVVNGATGQTVTVRVPK